MSPEPAGESRLPDLSDVALAACADIAADVDPRTDAESLLEQLEEWNDDHSAALTGLGIGDLHQAFAVSVGDAGTNLLLPIGEWTGVGTGLTGTVLVIPRHRTPTVTTWDDIRNDPDVRWWVRPDDAITGGCTEQGGPLPHSDEIEQYIPFAFDASAWESTFDDLENGARHVYWEGLETRFDLELVDHRYAETSDAPNEDGVCLSLEGGVRVHTFAVTDDVLWHDQAGIGETYIGRVAPTAMFRAITEAYEGWDSAPVSPIEFLESEVLDAVALRPLFDAVTYLDDNFDAESCEVSCTDFSGTAEEYIAATGGPTKRRKRSY